MTEMRRWMTVVESEKLPPGFADEGNGYFAFRCETGRGGITADFDRRACTIYEFSASDGGARRGNGRRTVQWLRRFFDEIDVVDPGDEGTESRLFWEAMQAAGLVSTLYDDEMRPLDRRSVMEAPHPAVNWRKLTADDVAIRDDGVVGAWVGDLRVGHVTYGVHPQTNAVSISYINVDRLAHHRGIGAKMLGYIRDQKITPEIERVVFLDITSQGTHALCQRVFGHVHAWEPVRTENGVETRLLPDEVWKRLPLESPADRKGRIGSEAARINGIAFVVRHA